MSVFKESDLEAYSPKVLWFITCDRQGEIWNMAHVYCCNSIDIRHLSSTTIGIPFLKYLYPIIEFLTISKCISLPNDFSEVRKNCHSQERGQGGCSALGLQGTLRNGAVPFSSHCQNADPVHCTSFHLHPVCLLIKINTKCPSLETSQLAKYSIQWAAV